MTKEEIYDQQIAPKLLELGKLCQENDIPFLAAVEYAPDELGETAYLGKSPGIAARMMKWAMEARGNLDLFVIKASRYVKEVCPTHNSVVLSILERRD